MRKILTILSILCTAYCSGQTISDAKPQNGYYDFLDSVRLRKPLLRTNYSGVSTLKILLVDTVSDVVHNSLSISELASSLGSSFIANNTSQQSSANFNIDGNGTVNGTMRVNTQLSINSAGSGSYGIYVDTKDVLVFSATSDGSTDVLRLNAANGGRRYSFGSGGLAMFNGYTTAPSQQTNTSFYTGRVFIGNDDASYLHISRYNSGTPYAIIEASQSASTAGNSGIQLISKDAGTQRISIQVENNGTLAFKQYGAGTLTTDASGNVTAASDIRLKDVQGNFTTGLDAIMKLNPITFKWKEGLGFDTKGTYVGFSAQNVKANIPYSTGIMPNGDLTLQDRALLATLVNAIQEQQREIEELKAIIRQLKK